MRSSRSIAGCLPGRMQRRERKKERPTTSCEEIDERHTYSTVKEPFDRDGISTRSHGGGAVTAE